MRKLTLAAATAAALLAGVSLAGAAEVTGVIKSIDAANNAITLDNGKTYKLSESIKPADWKEGDKVKVTYDEANGQMTVTQLVRESS
jgi:Cu/Ag efflux protein CusF